MLRFLSKIILISLTAIFLPVINFSQTATKFDEIGYLKCGDAINRFSAYFQFELQNKPQNKLYVIYYEGQYRATSIYDYKTKKHVPKLNYPRFGDALNKAKEIPLYLKKAYKIPANRIVLMDGGFRQEFGLEIWSISEGLELPKPTPTLARKDIRFAKGKPYRTKDLSRCYEGF